VDVAAPSSLMPARMGRFFTSFHAPLRMMEPSTMKRRLSGVTFMPGLTSIFVRWATTRVSWFSVILCSQQGAEHIDVQYHAPSHEQPKRTQATLSPLGTYAEYRHLTQESQAQGRGGTVDDAAEGVTFYTPELTIRDRQNSGRSWRVVKQRQLACARAHAVVRVCPIGERCK